MRLKVTAICLAAILVIYAGLSVVGAVKLMETTRLPLNDSPDSVGFTYEEVSFPSRQDNVALSGWYIPGEIDIVVVIVHGGIQNRVDENVDTLGLARDLVAEGYGILLFDLRGRGESAGRGLFMSNIECDIGGAVDYLDRRGYPAESVVLLGFSLGAASSCIYASQETLGALVLDGCFSNVYGILTSGAVAEGVPECLVKLFRPGIFWLARAIYGYEIVDPIDVISGVTCPIFFIHEERDDYVSWEDTCELFQAAANPANELWEVSVAEHSQAYKTHPAEYVAKIDYFLKVRFKTQ